ncbi:class I SAM-dependent methyltransferase [Georgenia halophila]|uniref:Class I SAM-dependent methyltransferase n=1 Tax=Georgenia halophila TaxID=620889 RepID=A0ABP8LGZ1_9MICO
MTTTTPSAAPASAPDGRHASPQAPPEEIEAFAGRMFDVLSQASTALMISIGHRTGLFDTLTSLPPSTSTQIAEAAGLQERYVREWLGAMTVARIVTHEHGTDRFSLPDAHAAVLARAAGPDNLSAIMQFIPLLSQVEDAVIHSFRQGGGVPYSAYTRFHELMSELSSASHDAALVEAIVPLEPGLTRRLTDGIRVADIGCGRGHSLNLLASAFPGSAFIGYDFADEAIDAARAEAAEWGLENASFEVRDVTDLTGTGAFDLITAFDAIHDQAHPATVLGQVAAHLAPDGIFLMGDMRASSNLEDNLAIPWSPFLYTVSTMHCMTVSLGLDGAGLGTVWGEQLALRMLADVGLTDVRVEQVEGDFINSYYVARR